MRGKVPDIVEPVICSCGDHAFAVTRRGFVIMVSPEDAHLLTRRWSVTVNRYGYKFVRRQVVAKPKKQSVLLSRAVMNPPAELQVDHINRDTLDNRRSNLRLCNRTQNAANSLYRKKSKTGLKGVWPSRGKYRASIKHLGVRYELGVFDDPHSAHQAYAEAAARIHGEFARPA